MSTERPPQVWLRCVTHDIRFKSRSAESQNHHKPECKVIVEAVNA